MKAIKNNVILIMLVLFLALVIGTFFRIYTAFETHPGLIVDDAFNSGENYAVLLNNNKKVGASNWDITITTLGELKSKSDIKFSVNSVSNMDGIHDSDFKILLFRPLEKKWDFEKKMVASDNNKDTFLSTISFPLKGVWDVVVEGVQGGLTHRATKRIFLKE